MSIRQQSSKTARLEARITAAQKELIERAAAYEGRTVSDFVLHSVQQAALGVIHEHETMRLNRAQSQAFVAMLLSPQKPKRALQKAADAYRRGVISS
jgi:uncharacterized protein (DUF1778 family)